MLPRRHLLLQCRLALGIQRHYPLRSGLERLQLLPLQLAALVGDHRKFRVELGTRHALEQGGALIDAGLQEGGELALGQDHGATELLPIEANLLVDQLLDIPLIARMQLLAGEALQRALLLLILAIGPIARATQLPAGPPDLTIDPDEVHLGIAAGLAATQDVPYIVGLEPVGFIFPPDLRLVLAVGHKARHLVIQRQTDGIQQCALTGTCIAGDGKQTRIAEHPLGKVDGERMAETGQIFTAQGQNFHDACS